MLKFDGKDHWQRSEEREEFLNRFRGFGKNPKYLYKLTCPNSWYRMHETEPRYIRLEVIEEREDNWLCRKPCGRKQSVPKHWGYFPTKKHALMSYLVMLEKRMERNIEYMDQVRSELGLVSRMLLEEDLSENI